MFLFMIKRYRYKFFYPKYRFIEAQKLNELNDVEAKGSTSYFSSNKDGEVIDFKGEAITFRETTSAIVDTLQVCLDIISQKDENHKKKLEKEIEKRNKTEEMYR